MLIADKTENLAQQSLILAMVVLVFQIKQKLLIIQSPCFNSVSLSVDEYALLYS